MSLDHQLIETIKANFARKSSAQLQDIVQSNNPERWSPEAVAAAGEILQDRSAGRALEPHHPEEDLRAPPRAADPTTIAFGVMFAMVGGLAGSIMIRPVLKAIQEGGLGPDLPVPFGPNMAWLALETTDTKAVAGALGLQEVRTAAWAEGIDAAQRGSLFITPPLADWTLATSKALIARERVDAAVKPLLLGLSRQFSDAQYFCTHREGELHVWARARQGQLVRGYGWLGEKRVTLWDEGKQTKEERDLGFEFLNPDSICVTPGTGSKAQQVPDEACVMQLASLWSIDPSSLDEYFKEPAMGLVGNVGREVRRDAVQ
jgi:hypothetical protein